MNAPAYLSDQERKDIHDLMVSMNASQESIPVAIGIMIGMRLSGVSMPDKPKKEA